MRSSRPAPWRSRALLLLSASTLWTASARAAPESDSRPDGNPRPAGEGPAHEAESAAQSLATAAQSLVKDRLGIAGSARGALFSQDLSSSGDSGFALGSLWLTAQPEAFFGVKTYVDARVQGQNLTRSFRPSWDLREAYVEPSVDDFDFRAGRQITVWGRADKVNPTDVWSTRDYTLLTTDDEDQRLGISAVQVAWNHWDHRLIAYWQPEWRAPLLPIPPLPAGVTLQSVTPRDPASQFGVKLDHSGGLVDYSLSYAHVMNRLPDLTVLAAGSSGELVGLQFDPVDVLGGDAAIVAGDFGLRAEAAYTRVRGSGTDPLTQRSNLFAVVGAERTFAGVFNINVQYLYRHAFNWQDPARIPDPKMQLLAQQETLASNQLSGDMQGASLRFDHKAFNETLETELAALTWFAKGDATLRPKVTYAFTDHLKGIVGAQIYLGPNDSFFGRLRSASTGFAELRYGF
jgi:hypothetical protein